jgi:hypothetical protein
VPAAAGGKEQLVEGVVDLVDEAQVVRRDGGVVPALDRAQPANERAVSGKGNALRGLPLQQLAQLVDLLDLLGRKSRTVAPRFGARTTTPMRSSSSSARRTAWRFALNRAMSWSRRAARAASTARTGCRTRAPAPPRRRYLGFGRGADFSFSSYHERYR